MGPTPLPVVVVCDDERHIVRLIQVNLERQGYRVFPTFDGYKAVEAVREHKAGLLVLDGDLASPSAAWVKQTVEADPETAGVKVILLKSKEDEPDPPVQPPPFITLTKPRDPLSISRLLQLD